MMKFTTADADRLLGLADQFLEDWDEDSRLAAPNEERAEFTQRRAEWDDIRPLLMQAPALFKALEAWAFADADPEAARRKGYYDRCQRAPR